MGFMKLFWKHPDVAIEFVIAFAISVGLSTLVPGIVSRYYGNVAQEHASDVGNEATDDTVIARSIDDILNNETFSIIVSSEESYKFDGSAYFEDEDPCEIYNVALESGERVAVRIYTEHLKDLGDGTYLLNIGKVNEFDLTTEQSLLDELQEEYSLDRTDFYVDLRTNVTEARKYSSGTIETITSTVKNFVIVFVGIFFWILLHVIAVKIGIAPALFLKK